MRRIALCLLTLTLVLPMFGCKKDPAPAADPATPAADPAAEPKTE